MTAVGCGVHEMCGLTGLSIGVTRWRIIDSYMVFFFLVLRHKHAVQLFGMATNNALTINDFRKFRRSAGSGQTGG